MNMTRDELLSRIDAGNPHKVVVQVQEAETGDVVLEASTTQAHLEGALMVAAAAFSTALASEDEDGIAVNPFRVIYSDTPEAAPAGEPIADPFGLPAEALADPVIVAEARRQMANAIIQADQKQRWATGSNQGYPWFTTTGVEALRRGQPWK